MDVDLPEVNPCSGPGEVVIELKTEKPLWSQFQST